MAISNTAFLLHRVVDEKGNVIPLGPNQGYSDIPYYTVDYAARAIRDGLSKNPVIQIKNAQGVWVTNDHQTKQIQARYDKLVNATNGTKPAKTAKVATAKTVFNDAGRAIKALSQIVDTGLDDEAKAALSKLLAQLVVAGDLDPEQFQQDLDDVLSAAE